MAEYQVTNTSTGESFTLSDSSYYYGSLSMPKRSHKRKKAVILLLLAGFSATAAPVIMSVMAGYKEGKIAENLLMNWPFIFIGICLFSVCATLLGIINKIVRRINKIDFDKGDIDAEHNPYGFSGGENINYKNNVPLDVLNLLDAKKDKRLLEAVELAKVEYYEYQHREASPQKEWVEYRIKYISEQGTKYDGKGEVYEKGFGKKSGAPYGGGFGDKIGVKWEDINGIPRFYHYPLYENVKGHIKEQKDYTISSDGIDIYKVIFRDRDSVPLDMLIDNYISLRFGKLLAAFKKLVWAIYPLFILSLALQAIPQSTLLNALSLSSNTLGLLCVGVAIYKNFASISKLGGSKKAILHSVIAYFSSAVTGIFITDIISQSFNILNSTTLCMAVICDIILMIDVAILKYNDAYKAKETDITNYKPPIHWAAVLCISIFGFAVLGVVVLVLSITIPTILEEILAFDNGTGTTLTKAITFWIVGFALDIIVSVGVALIVNRLLQKRDLQHFNAQYSNKK